MDRMTHARQGAVMVEDHERALIELIGTDQAVMEALAAVRDLALADCWIAAGFVRNRVWDHLHGYTEATPLNDIDVVYFDPASRDEAVEKRLEATLMKRLPGQPWSVKNQARMAVLNGDRPYRDTAHALEHWCETPTPIGVRLTTDARPAADARPAVDVRPAAEARLEVIAPLGLDDLFAMIVRPTPHTRAHPQKRAQYRERMATKNWPRLWPGIRVLEL